MEVMVLIGLGGVHARQRLGDVLRKMEGSPAQISKLFRDRDGTPTVDIEALLAS